MVFKGDDCIRVKAADGGVCSLVRQELLDLLVLDKEDKEDIFEEIRRKRQALRSSDDSRAN